MSVALHIRGWSAAGLCHLAQVAPVAPASSGVYRGPVSDQWEDVVAKISVLGIPHDENSSYLRGPAEAPPLIRRELASDAYSSWTETGFDLTDRFVDHGDIDFSQPSDPWQLIETAVGRALDAGHPLISLGGDHAVSWPVLRAVRQRHQSLTIVHIDAHPDIYHPMTTIRARTPRPSPASWRRSWPTG